MNFDDERCECDYCRGRRMVWMEPADWTDDSTLPADAPETVNVTLRLEMVVQPPQIAPTAGQAERCGSATAYRRKKHAFYFKQFSGIPGELDAVLRRAADAERDHETVVQLYTKADEAARAWEKRAADAEQANRQIRKDLEAAREEQGRLKNLHSPRAIQSAIDKATELQREAESLKAGIGDLRLRRDHAEFHLSRMTRERDEERARADRLQTQIDIERDSRHGWVRGMPFEGR